MGTERTGRRVSVYGPGKVEIETFALPETLAAGDLLVEVECSLISPGTELSGYQHDRREAGHPGYTAVGTVLAGGEGTDPALVGRRVFVFPEGTDSNGCHASHKVLRAGGLAVPVPDGLDSGAACFARMINIGLTPYANVQSKSFGSVLVIGLGLVGNVVAQVGRLRGWRTLGLDPDKQRRQRALASGVDEAISPADGDPAGMVKALTGGRGADLVVDCTGHSATMLTALSCAATGGEVSLLGGARHSHQANLQEVVQHIWGRHVTVRGGWEMLLPRRSSPALAVSSTEDHLRWALRWLSDGALTLEPIWTHTLEPEQFGTAYDALNGKDPAYLGVIVRWR